MMMKAFREQGRRHQMSHNILKSPCTDMPSHNIGQNHRPCPMPPCWKVAVAKGRDKDLVWELATFASKGTHTIPVWSGLLQCYNIRQNCPSCYYQVHYLHTCTRPTDISTIYTTLLKLVAGHILVTGDLAIYLKTQQILRYRAPSRGSDNATWWYASPHGINCQYLQVIWGWWPPAASDSNRCFIYQGKQLNRAVRRITCKLVLEALFHIYPTSAQSWCHSQGIQWLALDTDHGITDLQHTFRAKDKDSSRHIIDNLDTSGVTEALGQFQAMGRSPSATFKIWNNFMYSAHNMLRLLRVERDDDLDLHLDAVCETWGQKAM